MSGGVWGAAADFAAALGAKDSYTAAHAHRVAELTESVGLRLGMTAAELRTLRLGGLLHDVGKIGIGSELLSKAGPLTPEELEQVERHTIIGAEMLRRNPYFVDVHPLVRSSHERWDGRGYPDGRRGEEIPLGARIIHACDAFHAMTSNRPYRRAMPTRAAITELRRHAGSQFDPSVVEELTAVLSEGAASEPGAAVTTIERGRAARHRALRGPRSPEAGSSPPWTRAHSRARALRLLRPTRMEPRCARPTPTE